MGINGQLLGGTLPGGALASLQAITNGGFRVTVDTVTTTSVNGFNLTGAANLTGVAAIISPALTLGGVLLTMAYDSGNNRFVLTSPTVGPTSAVSFLSPPVAGTDISTLLACTSVTGATLIPGSLTAATITPAQFRADFPEFSNTTVWPDSQVLFWLNVASQFVVGARWGSLSGYGIELFAAHNLYLEAQSQQTAAAGGIGGTNKGPVNSEGVGGVTVGYDTATSTVKGTGLNENFNLTTYGTRFLNAANLLGIGPLQVGGTTGVAGAVNGAFGGQAFFGPPLGLMGFY